MLGDTGGSVTLPGSRGSSAVGTTGYVQAPLQGLLPFTEIIIEVAALSGDRAVGYPETARFFEANDLIPWRAESAGSCRSTWGCDMSEIEGKLSRDSHIQTE